MLLAAEGDPVAAAGELQRSLAALKPLTIYPQMYEAMGAVAGALLESGDFRAGRALLVLQSQLSKDDPDPVRAAHFDQRLAGDSPFAQAGTDLGPLSGRRAVEGRVRQSDGVARPSPLGRRRGGTDRAGRAVSGLGGNLAAPWWCCAAGWPTGPARSRLSAKWPTWTSRWRTPSRPEPRPCSWKRIPLAIWPIRSGFRFPSGRPITWRRSCPPGNTPSPRTETSLPSAKTTCPPRRFSGCSTVRRPRDPRDSPSRRCPASWAARCCSGVRRTARPVWKWPACPAATCQRFARCWPRSAGRS